MSKNPLDNQFEDLFSNLEHQSSPLPPPSEDPLPGWTWECDDQGNYIACSPEVEAVLGYTPQDFLGQPLISFALTPESVDVLQSALEEKELPLEITLDYTTHQGERIPTSLHILELPAEGGEQIRWRGFAQAIFPSDRGPHPPALEAPHRPTPASSPETEIQARKAQAKEKALAILEELRLNSMEVNAFPFSRITTKEREEMRDNRTKKPIPTGHFAGRKVYAYPKIAVHKLELKLEWGKKLDLTEKESLFTATNKFRAPGLRGLFQHRFAPKAILKTDVNWIAIQVEILEGKSQSLWVDYQKDDKDARGVDLDEFLQRPEIILPELQKALDNPKRVQVYYRYGEDYLISK